MHAHDQVCLLRWRMLLPVVALLVLSSGCAEQAEEEEVDVVRPVKTLVIAAPEAGGERKFPARIDAVRKAELSFRVSGKVEELNVKEGDPVTEGQVLAKLDTTDFEIALADRQATYDNARKDYERAKELVEKGFLSRTDFDKKESEFRSAEAALRQAKQDLAYTELKAPFDGLLAKRHIERFEQVQVKQQAFSLRGTEELEFVFDVPEGIMKPLEVEEVEIPVYATFDVKPGERFPLAFREAATRADPKTQTFEVRYTMRTPRDFTLLPGMTATVTADLRGVFDDEQLFFLPVTAIAADSKLAPFVWVVDEASGEVAMQPVELGRMVGNEIAVTAELEPGQHVVTAGTGYLAEGMAVRTVDQPEQARPRPDDLPLMLEPDSPAAPAGASSDGNEAAEPGETE